MKFENIVWTLKKKHENDLWNLGISAWFIKFWESSWKIGASQMPQVLQTYQDTPKLQNQQLTCLVNIQKTMERSTMFDRKTHYFNSYLNITRRQHILLKDSSKDLRLGHLGHQIPTFFTIDIWSEFWTFVKSCEISNFRFKLDSNSMT